MKKRTSLLLILTMIIGMIFPLNLGTASAANYNVKVLVNGEYVDFSGGFGRPFISDENRTLVPIRATAEAYGCNVEWDASRREVRVTFGPHYAVIPIGSYDIYTDSGTKTMDTYARILDDRTYIPIRFTMEAMGAVVGWEERLTLVTISNPEIYTYVPTADNDSNLTALKGSVKTRGSYDSPAGYIYNGISTGNDTMTARLIFDPVVDAVYVCVYMDLDGSSGNSYSEMKVRITGRDNDLSYYTFTVVNSGTALSWVGHFDKAHYSDQSCYVVDSTSNSQKDIKNSVMLNGLTVYEAGLAIQAVDRYCSSAGLGFSSSIFGYAG